LPYWGGEVDCCINAFTLANGAWLGTDVSSLHEWFVEHQLADGGWNCEWVEEYLLDRRLLRALGPVSLGRAFASSFHRERRRMEGPGRSLAEAKQPCHP
jgi:hypothetical protein